VRTSKLLDLPPKGVYFLGISTSVDAVSEATPAPPSHLTVENAAEIIRRLYILISLEIAAPASPLVVPAPGHAVRPLQAQEPTVLPAAHVLDHIQIVPVVVNPVHRTGPVILYVAGAVAVGTCSMDAVNSMKRHE
jgi:hypothetical protein